MRRTLCGRIVLSLASGFHVKPAWERKWRTSVYRHITFLAKCVPFPLDFVLFFPRPRIFRYLSVSDVKIDCGRIYKACVLSVLLHVFEGRILLESRFLIRRKYSSHFSACSSFYAILHICDNNWSSRRDIISVQCHDSTTFSFHSDLCGNIQCRDAMSRENEQWYARSFPLTRETNATLFLEACLYSERQRGAEYTTKYVYLYFLAEEKKERYAIQFSRYLQFE